MPELRIIDARGVAIRAALAGSGPLVLLVHGFPESWYSYRHQLAPIADAGFTACAVDVRGYGGSQRFPEVGDYALEPIVRDLLGVADALSPDRPVVLVGHDWGAPIVYASALIHPERFGAVAGMSVVHGGVPERSFDDVIARVFDARNRFFYQSYFREPGRAEAAFERDPRDFLCRFYCAISGDAEPGAWPTHLTASDALLDGLGRPRALPHWLGEADLDYYAGEFARSGFFGPLSRYRNHTRDFHYLQAFRERTLEQPALFIGGDRDPALNLLGAAIDPIAVMRRCTPNLEAAHLLQGCGHWTQQERPAEVNALLVPWLASLRGRVV